MRNDQNASVKEATVIALGALKDPRAEEAIGKVQDKTAKNISKSSISVRGGFGEPYCSQECYDNGGKYISAIMLKKQAGVCGFCQNPVEASMYGELNCAVVPYEGVNLFICNSCTTQGKAHFRDYQQCCMCQKAL